MWDIVIIGAWALKEVLFLEKNEQVGNKLLLSWNGRCNFTNLIFGKEHYYGDNKDRLDNLFSNFWVKDMVDFLEKNGIETKEEDHWRMFLKSDKSKQLLNFFFQRNKELGHEFELGKEVVNIKKEKDYYVITTKEDLIQTKKIVIACWWKSFPQIGGSDFIFQFAETFWIATQSPTPALCWIKTKENFSSLSWSSVPAKIIVKNKSSEALHEDFWIVLFTHRWISGPGIFNLSLALARYSNELNKLKIKLIIEGKDCTKRLLNYLKAPKGLKNYTLTINPESFSSRETAKVMSGWVCFSELTDQFELKKAPWIYLIGEAINITWETWGYNLQWCWTSAWCCSKAFLV